MTTNKDLTRLSKKLALILRHKPESANIKLDKNGWARTDDILKALGINMSILETIVMNDKKGRYAFDECKQHIRAVQGHSVNVDLALTPIIPPDVLYHGTGSKSVDAILRDGIRKMSRQYVHLSSNINTAIQVGSRHGKAFVLQIDTKQMAQDGCLFYQAENGVWLTDYVATKYITPIYQSDGYGL